jgi:hypothetical protein
MPYIHWESYSRQVEENRLLDDIKEQSLKTRIWRSHDMLSAAKNWIRRPDGVGKPSPQNLGSSEEPSRAIEKKTTDYDAELLDTYLFKPWPLHLRPTLSQYYYSYLADTPKRDCNQVAMRARSRKLRQESTFTAKLVNKETQNSEDVSRPDRNSSVIMVDQLWLWIVSQGRFTFAFYNGS